MTSSLVGSEMCIRDRFTCAARHPVRSKRAQRDLLTRHHMGVMVHKMIESCLLYTSDAADDM
eukprot:5563466-Prorocentrum_lima.AAC.1